MIVSFYSPTNVSEKTDIITFYNEPSSLVWHIRKHNVLIIGGDMNAQVGKDGNNKFCFPQHTKVKQGNLADFTI